MSVFQYVGDFALQLLVCLDKLINRCLNKQDHYIHEMIHTKNVMIV